MMELMLLVLLAAAGEAEEVLQDRIQVRHDSRQPGETWSFTLERRVGGPASAKVWWIEESRPLSAKESSPVLVSARHLELTSAECPAVETLFGSFAGFGSGAALARRGDRGQPSRRLSFSIEGADGELVDLTELGEAHPLAVWARDAWTQLRLCVQARAGG